jgi:hypothetical protein
MNPSSVLMTMSYVVKESEYGMRYVIEGLLCTPDGRNPVVRTVWILDDEAKVPRLVTAYPIDGAEWS